MWICFNEIFPLLVFNALQKLLFWNTNITDLVMIFIGMFKEINVHYISNLKLMSLHLYFILILYFYFLLTTKKHRLSNHYESKVSPRSLGRHGRMIHTCLELPVFWIYIYLSCYETDYFWMKNIHFTFFDNFRKNDRIYV